MFGEEDIIGVGGSVILHRLISGLRLEIVVKDRGHCIYSVPENFFGGEVASKTY
jgi:hypothetical protein